MSFQLAVFDPLGESWHFYREDFEIVEYATLEEAEAEAQKLSSEWDRREVIVLTLHSAFVTSIIHPTPPAPIRRTDRVPIRTRRK